MTAPKKDHPGDQRGDHRDDKGKFLPGNPGAWRPGQSGNPKGRPPTVSLVTTIKARLAEATRLAEMGLTLKDKDGKPQRPPTLEEISDAFLWMTLLGTSTSVSAIAHLMERLDGKVPQRTLGEGDQTDALSRRQALEAFRSKLLAAAEDQPAEPEHAGGAGRAGGEPDGHPAERPAGRLGLLASREPDDPEQGD